MKNLLKIMLTASLCVSASIAAPQKGSMTDPRDGKTYKTVKIGDQVWMAENLAFEINEINGNPGSTNDCLILGGNGKKRIVKNMADIIRRWPLQQLLALMVGVCRVLQNLKNYWIIQEIP